MRQFLGEFCLRQNSPSKFAKRIYGLINADKQKMGE
jgi:hypothetical protein